MYVSINLVFVGKVMSVSEFGFANTANLANYFLPCKLPVRLFETFSLSLCHQPEI